MQIRQSFSVLIVMVSSSLSLFAQNPKNDAFPKGVLSANNCENNISIMSRYAQEPSMNKTIIIISYPGKKERTEFSIRRLHNARAFIAQSQYGRENSLIITAKGNSVKGQGFLDFFIGGILEERLLFPKNQDLKLSGCQFEPEVKPCSTSYENLFYPCLGRKK